MEENHPEAIIYEGADNLAWIEFNDGELGMQAVCKDFLLTAADGKKAREIE